jgi:hypothetical protein
LRNDGDVPRKQLMNCIYFEHLQSHQTFDDKLYQQVSFF